MKYVKKMIISSGSLKPNETKYSAKIYKLE